MPYKDSLFDLILKHVFRFQDVATLSEARIKAKDYGLGTYTDITGDDPGDLYLRRYYLYRGKRRPHLYLHHIIRSDYDRAPHDHPWSFTSIILWRGYIEHRQSVVNGETVKWHHRFYPGAMLHRTSRDLHRLELWKPAWTLVFSGEKVREWGFLTDDKGWIPWYTLKQYIKDMM